MQGILKVTPNELISVADEFNSQGSTIGNLTSGMTNLVTGLSSVWEGDAAQAYIARFRGLEDDIGLLIRMVNEHVTDLREMATQYLQAEEQNLDDIATLSSDVII